MTKTPKYPGERITANGNQLVSYHTEARITDAGVYYPITPSTEGGELYQQSFAEGRLNVFGRSTLAIEAEGEHAAQGGAIAYSVCGRRVVNFTSGQGLPYASEQYYHAPGKASTMIVQVGARALTKHALNVHCGHDDINGVLDTGWIIAFAKDAQQAADQALILRRVTELSLTPGMNVQDGFLTSHLERTFYRHESELIREFLGAPEDIIECPTEAQRTLFGPTRRRVPRMYDLANPVLLGPVQNQEHYMQGVVARRNNFIEPILSFLEASHEDFGRLTGRHYGLLSEYKTEHAETVFVSLGSAAENCEAAVDYLRDTRGAKVGSIHVNVLRPFPERAIARALAGKKNVIILERTDEPLAGDNPLGRDIRTALNKALIIEGHPTEEGFLAIQASQVPRIFNGIYGLGSRDFRPEQILGAYEYAVAGRARTDGRTAADGDSFFVLGVPHKYEVKSEDTPSLLPDGAIAVRFHSIGGWGAITTGKNLGAIIGDFNDFLSARSDAVDEFGRPKEVIHVSANPKYGSEKKGAPTSYFLVVAPERIRVNCDLRHVDVVLCCDPKAFTHTNPLDGMSEGGALIWESEESAETAWERLPIWARQQILDKKIRVFTLPGFEIARKATSRQDLQLRMQGNAFLGAFFKVSPLLQDFEISSEQFEEVVRNQYKKKFGRLGPGVVKSNMEVMTQGFGRVTEISVGKIAAADRSTLRGLPMLPLDIAAGGCGTCRSEPAPAEQVERTPVTQVGTFDAEFRADYGYDQPASALAALGVMAAGTGDTASKYVARRETPLFIPENCTQCMECISVCPDTALPNCSQDIDTVLRAAIAHYVADDGDRVRLLEHVPEIERRSRELMLETVTAKGETPFPEVVRTAMNGLNGFSEESREQLFSILDSAPMAYTKTNAIFRGPEKKNAGSGGVFSIFVSDLCKGCAACVTACGDHDALRMVQETEAVNAEHETGTAFLNLLPDTEQKFLGFYNDEHPADSKTATLRNHLMVRRNYDALVSGDGACAGCGEKSVLRAIASVTEACMRPLYHAKAERFSQKATQLRATGVARLASLTAATPAQYTRFVRTVAHVILGLGGDSEADTTMRLEAHGPISDEEVVDALATVLEQEAFNHRELQALDGRLANGTSVMAMAAHTGCNTVYGSTPPNNPHPYPWMNSLFQDGATIGWLFGESFIIDHARRSVVPERLTDALLGIDESAVSETTAVVSEQQYYEYTHFGDTLMTDAEINELPKVWIVGGDGGMGDIGYQNVSKMVLQNRPNVNAVMLDTQVYSNTGGQNSDSTPMLGGSDMNAFGAATQGKVNEKKTVAETFLAGHGSPFVAQTSIANAPKFFRAIIDALEYRGTGFLQCFTTCQPEHGVADDMALDQAQRVRDSRGASEFIFNPQLGETYPEALDVKGNPSPDKDWYITKFKSTGEKYRYTVAHWCATEARFRNHVKRVKNEEDAGGLIPLENMLLRLSQQDIVYRRYLDPAHRAFVPDFGVYMRAPGPDGKPQVMTLSRQLVLFCVERRKAWRLLQSKAGIENKEYGAQRSLLVDVDAGSISKEEFFARAEELFEERLLGLAATKTA